MDDTVIRGKKHYLMQRDVRELETGKEKWSKKIKRLDERKLLWGAEEMREGEKVGLPRSEEADR